jgi:hypothetical protein
MILNSGLPVIIEWHKFIIGSSFYIPTLDPDKLTEDIKREAQERNMHVKLRFCLENGTQGVRVWRIG